MIKPILRYTAFLVMLLAGMTACVPKKDMVYLQAAEGAQDSVFVYERIPYKLQSNDIIDVRIVSLDEEVNKLFNFNTGNNINQAAQTANLGDMYYATGYSLDLNGEVDLPIIGKVPVSGLTLEEAHAKIDTYVQKYFSKYYLVVKLGGVRFSAIGEFARPGKYTILQNQATIFDAISTAGDLLMTASRSDVKVIRQYPDGTRIHTVNLLDRNVINTPYYFVQPGDMIYVEPLKAKSWGVGTNAAQSATLLLSIISSTLLIIVSFANLK